MKKSLVLAMAMALGVTASAYASNPFSDVPAGHWAYSSVAQLAQAGVVEGYDDASFGGDKLITRYEMAQIVARAMAKGSNNTEVDRLAAEFADELDSLGVRVANLEKKMDNVKITGEIRYHYADSNDDFDCSSSALRSRLWVNGKVNDDWSYTGMIQNMQDFRNADAEEDTEFKRAYIDGKIGGVDVRGGRYNLNIAEGNVYDNNIDGIQATYGKDLKVVAGYGKLSSSPLESVFGSESDNHEFGVGDNTIEIGPDKAQINDAKIYYAELQGQLQNLKLAAGYYKIDAEVELKDQKSEGKFDAKPDIWAVSANYAIDNNVNVGAMYLKGDDLGINGIDDDGYIFSASYKGAKADKVGSWGVNAKYYDQGRTTYIDHTMNGVANEMLGFKGYSLSANYTLAKNIVGQVEYYDLEEKEGNERKADTIWSQVVFSF